MIRRVTDGGSLEQLIGQMVKDPPSFLAAQVTAVDDSSGKVTVDLGGGDHSVSRLLSGPVTVGSTVLVVRDGNRLTVLGTITTTSRPVAGTVAAVPANSYTIVVTTSIGAVTAVFPASYNPSVGDQVLLIWQGSVAVAFHRGQNGSPSGALGFNVVFPTAPPAATSDPSAGVNTFPAVSAATRRSGAWRNDVGGRVLAGALSGDPNVGVWFTGSRPQATLPGVTVTSCAIWLARDTGGSAGPQTVHLYRTADPTPAGDPAPVGDPADVSLDVGDAGWYDLPAALGQALVDTGGSVLATTDTGVYVRLFGLAQSGQAGALRLAWRTDS